MKPIIKILILLIIPITLFANGGSVYSRYGIGDLVFLNSARNLGLGGIGLSIADGNYINSLNPAAWYKIPLTRFELGMNYSGKEISDNASSAFYSNVKFSGFVIGFPIERSLGISLVGGLVPYSQVEYELIANIQNPAVEDEFQMDLKGSGGLNKLFIGTSYLTPLDFALGLSFEYYTGKIEYSSKIDFPLTSFYKDATYLNTHVFKGVGTNIGVMSSDLSKYLGIEKLTDLKIGFNYNSILSMKADTTLYASTSIGIESLQSGLMDVNLPSRIGFGASFVWDKDYLVFFDYIAQSWSNYSYNEIGFNHMTDFYRLNLGFEHKNHNVRYPTFMEQITLRGGLSYEQSQYSFDGTDINQFSLHAGFSVPISLESTIDIGFEYGIRGTKDNNLLKENIYKAFLSINFGELWFIRQER